MGGFGTFALGVTAALAARAFAPALGRIARPALRGVLKQGIILSRGAQVRAAGLREDLEDLMAEAQAELKQSAATTGANGASSPSPRPSL